MSYNFGTVVGDWSQTEVQRERNYLEVREYANTK